MKKHEQQRLAYDYLQSRIGETTTSAELATAAGWRLNTASTYLSKHLKGLVERVKGTDNYKVRREFRRLSFEQYARLADQTRRIFQTYKREEYGAIVTFEFLLPLTQESKLRRALDDIFYVDSMIEVLEELGSDRFHRWIRRKRGQHEAAYLREVANQAGTLFGGYSVSHVSGRFRGDELMTRNEAAALFQTDRSYLVDETTASVRFIVPLHATKVQRAKEGREQLILPMGRPSAEDKDAVDDQIELIRTLFFCLFVEALIRNVTGEDQIWLIESSPSGRRLHVWQPD